MSIRVVAQGTFGSFRLDASFECPATGVVSLFGPSGAGKSTLLRFIAGLETGCTGTVEIAGTRLYDSASKIDTPPHRRQIGFVFQEPSLFPHLNVEQNVLYGYRRAQTRSLDPATVFKWLDLNAMMRRDVNTLSGGERQRVAIARAVLAGPRLLLLDEPLSAVDENRKQEISRYIETLQQQLALPVLYVSHSIPEITRIAEYMIRIENGAISDTGSVSDVIHRLGLIPGNAREALCLLTGTVTSRDTTYNLSSLQTPFGLLWCPGLTHPVGSPVRVQVHARDVSLGLRHETDTSILNQLDARVGRITEVSPSQVMVELVSPLANQARLLALITRRSNDQLGLKSGLPVSARIKSVGIVE